MAMTVQDTDAADLAPLTNLLALAASPLRLRALRFLATASAPATLAAICAACDLGSVGNLAVQLDLLRGSALVQAVTARGVKDGPTMYRITERGRALVDAAAALERRMS